MKIEIQDLCFGYGSIPVLEGIDLTFDKPGLYCIIGPNGVGKSTLIKCMLKLLKPTSGHILIDGRDVDDISSKEMSKMMSFVPAGTTDVFSMTVLDTVLMGMHNGHHWKASAEDVRKAYSVMKLMGIEPLAMREFKELSAGQHQKVAIARGIAQDTETLILDEPTSNLDIRHQLYVTEMLKCIADRSGKTVIMISHDLNIASKYADQVIVLRPPGKIYTVGTPGEVITEQMLKDVYGISGEIVEFADRPHMMADAALPDANGRL